MVSPPQKHVYRLVCPTKPYDWGCLGKHNGKVAQFAASTLDAKVLPDVPYAELWMGAHPSGPALLLNENSQDAEFPLSAVLNSSSLGNEVYEEYGSELPFLFKVLSVRRALSIQAHPDKALGRKLHCEKPDIYKDPNHKPEMAIALTDFEALCGFRAFEEIAYHLDAYPELRALTGKATAEEFQRAVKFSSPEGKKSALKAVFRSIMKGDADFIAEQVETMVERLKERGRWKQDEMLHTLILRLSDQFPGDVGIFCALLLNYIVLKPGQSLFLGANEPHAYLSGDCVECMAASDNVVRAGLTPKFKDVDVLVNMLNYTTKSPKEQVMTPTAFEPPATDLPFPLPTHSVLYDPPIEEFSVLQTTLPSPNAVFHASSGNPSFKPISETIPPLKGPSILIVVQGSIKIKAFIPSETENTSMEVVMEGEALTGHVYFISAGVAVRMEPTEHAGDKNPSVIYRAFCELKRSQMQIHSQHQCLSVD